jgi:hypothetical protein
MVLLNGHICPRVSHCWVVTIAMALRAALPAVQLSAYQRRTVAHMLREETAPGGSARHLWAQLSPPSQPGGRLACGSCG